MTDNVDFTDPKELNPPASEDELVVREAKRRFHRCENWEGNARQLFLEDLKFANADADNGYQWPNKIRTNRDIDERPCLTINKTQVHNNQIINDGRQNKPSVKIRPTGSNATYQSAQAFEDVIRHIEYISNAQAAYDTARKFQVDAGIGYYRLVTDYAGDDTFDQEIYIRRVKDPLNVYLDPDAQETDKSDGKFGFVFDDMSKDDFATQYPDYTHLMSRTALGNGDGWIDRDHVRVAEYFRVVQKKDKLIALTDPNTGELTIVKWSEIPPMLREHVVDDPTMKSRHLYENQVEWFLIVGDEIAEKTKWLGKYIPIIPVIGTETIINGELDRKGHTRAQKDPQRMLNYWASAGVEQVALQTKSPFIAPAAAIEGLEVYWRTANKTNYSVLPYNHRDDEGLEIAKPERAQVPTMTPAYIQGFEMSLDQLMQVTGQFQANFGENGQERSGKAINERQRMGDRATYHFIDNEAVAIRSLGRQLIDLVPKVYDTKRVLRIMGEDGKESELEVNPDQQQAFQEQKNKQMDKVFVRRIFNPSVGRYDVMADVGPAYATRRQEAWNAFTQITAQNPELMNVIGDLLFRNADFPGADKIAERLERLVPPTAKGEGPTPNEQKMQTAIDTLQQLLKKQSDQLAQEKLRGIGKEQQKDINSYKAVTDRLRIMLEHHEITPRMVVEMMHDLLKEEHKVSLAPVVDASAPDLEEAARGGGDGVVHP